jgi:alkylmercury lyase
VKTPNPSGIARALVDRLGKTIISDECGFLAQVLQILVEGHPVSIDQIANRLSIPPQEITAYINQFPNVQFDNNGNIVGAGLTLIPTPHRFKISGRTLFVWCAIDALTFPIMLKKIAYVESLCPVTEMHISLTVTPERVEHIEPSDAVVSIVIPDTVEACCNIRNNFCNYVNFFSSTKAAFIWFDNRFGAIILSVKDSYRVGRTLADNLTLNE